MNKRHPTDVFGAPPAVTAEALADLRYDALRDVIFGLMCRLRNDGIADANRGRPQLAAELEKAAMALGLAHYHLVGAWKICRLHEKTDP